MNSNHPDEVATKVQYITDRIKSNRRYKMNNAGRYLDEMYLPYATKHKLARELFHHENWRAYDDPQWHESKTSIDKVLEEMTRYRPNSENRERIRNAIDTFKQSHPDLHAYLKDKYKFATEDEEVGPFKSYEPHEEILSHEEVEKYKDKHVFTQGRTISDKWGEDDAPSDTKKWQIHPDGTKTRVSAILPHTIGESYGGSYDHPFADDDYKRQQDYHHRNLKELHGEHIQNGYFHAHINAYTNDSRPLNNWLAKGKLMDYESHTRVHVHEEQSNAISEAMHSSPPYANKIQVWTGLSKSNDVGAYAAAKRDEKEKLVGHFPAFTSTSLDVKQAAAFAKPKDAQGFENQKIHDLMRVDVPKAYHRGIYVDDVSDHSGEQEYILDKGHNIEVHPKPLYYARSSKLFRVWKGRPILSDDDQATIKSRERHARED
jgi:hypothetical protein